MSEKFEVGDVVRFKSGGRTMTVTEAETEGEDEEVRVVWFAKGRVRKADVSAKALVSATDVG